MSSNYGPKTERKPNLYAHLIERDGDQCVYCKTTLTAETRTLDHIIPKGQGGSNARSNLVLACDLDNAARGNLPYDEYKQAIELAMERGLSLQEFRERARNSQSLGFITRTQLKQQPFKDLNLDILR